MLNEVPFTEGGTLSHLGIQVATTDDVLKTRERWVESGLLTVDEMKVDCCYALQDKTWARDPDGNEWEVFVVLENTEPFAEACHADKGRSRRTFNRVCCTPAQRLLPWQQQITLAANGFDDDVFFTLSVHALTATPFRCSISPIYPPRLRVFRCDDGIAIHNYKPCSFTADSEPPHKLVLKRDGRARSGRRPCLPLNAAISAAASTLAQSAPHRCARIIIQHHKSLHHLKERFCDLTTLSCGKCRSLCRTILQHENVWIESPPPLVKITDIAAVSAT